MKECEICRGSRTIRLPIYRPLAVSDDVRSARDMVREYPCPECCGMVPENRISVVAKHSMLGMEYARHLQIRTAIHAQMAAKIGRFLLENNLIRFDEGKEDVSSGTVLFKGTVGVVSPKHVASIEERASESQEQFAREVLSDAMTRIDNWGSAYGQDWIYKTQVGDSLREALLAAIDRREREAA